MSCAVMMTDNLRKKMMMDHNDLAIATGGISAPLWLPALNEWVALLLGVASLIYVGIKIYKSVK